MAAPTNQKHCIGCSEPAYCKLQHSVNNTLGGKLSRLKNTFQILASCKQQHDKVLSESKFMQLLIFKRNGQLRKEKSIQLLKRVQTCLKRFYIGGKVFQCANNLSQDTCSALVTAKEGCGKCLLPSRQIWMFTLFLISKYAELLLATGSYCVAAYGHLSCQLSTGMLIPQMLLFMGAVSRIWLLSNNIREKLFQVYKELYVILDHVSKAPSQWVEPPLLPTLIGSEACGQSNTHPSNRTEVQMLEHVSAHSDNRLQKDDAELTSFTTVDDDEEDLGELVTDIPRICERKSHPTESDIILSSSTRKRKMDHTDAVHDDEEDLGELVTDIPRICKRESHPTESDITLSSSTRKRKMDQTDDTVKKKKNRKKIASKVKSQKIDKAERCGSTVKETFNSLDKSLKKKKKKRSCEGKNQEKASKKEIVSCLTETRISENRVEKVTKFGDKVKKRGKKRKNANNIPQAHLPVGDKTIKGKKKSKKKKLKLF